jgi:hypothetical protein
MAAPRQMTEHTLNALKGWPSPHAVDHAAPLSESIDVANLPVLGGSVVRLNAAGKYELGVGTLNVMPLFLFQNSDDPDVQNDGGDPATDKGVFVAITPSGKAMALVASGAYELTSTEFVDDTYAPNDPLTSAIAGATAGKIKKGTLYTDMIVGIVSRGKVDNGYGFDAIAFWPTPVFPTP